MRKYDNEEVKQAVFRLLHEPPAKEALNYAGRVLVCGVGA
jgi:hypothetical protein